MYLNWKLQGTEDFRKSWIKALEGTLSHSLITASFSDEFTGYLYLYKLYLQEQNQTQAICGDPKVASDTEDIVP